MGEAITTIGNLAGACGHDGTDWIKLLVDGDGKLQITVDTSGLPTGAATSANQITMITALQLIDDLRNALDSVGTDEIDVNVEESVLPTGAATSANQTSMITALQLIDDLRNALDSVGTDELDVNIEESVALDVQAYQYTGAAWVKSNVLWGFNDTVSELVSDTNLPAGAGIVYGTQVPEGEVWVITHIQAAFVSATFNRLRILISIGGVSLTILDTTTVASGIYYMYDTTPVIMSEGDRAYARAENCTAGDDGYLVYVGYKMRVDM